MNNFKHNLSFNILLTISNIVFPLITFPYISRILAPAGLGQYNFIITFAQYFVFIAALGIPVYGSREITRVRSNPKQLNTLFTELVLLAFLSSLFLFCIYLLVISHSWFHHDFKLYLLAGISVLTGFFNVEWLYIGLEKFKLLSVRSILLKSVQIVFLFIFVRTKQDLTVYLMITILATLLLHLVNFISVFNKVRFSIGGLNLKRHLRSVLILFATSLSISVYTSMDILLLGFLSNSSYVGFYTAAIKINKIAIPIVLSFGVTLTPQVTKAFAENNFKYVELLITNIFAFICLLSTPIAFGLFIFSDDIIRVFSGPDFIKAIPTLEIASPLIVLVGFGHVFGNLLLIPFNLELRYLKATLIGMFVSVALNLVLIPFLKDKGAAISIVLAEVAVTGISLYYTKLHLAIIRFNWKLFTKAVTASLIFVPLSYIIESLKFNPLASLCIALSCGGALYFLIQWLLFKEPILVGLISKNKEKKIYYE